MDIFKEAATQVACYRMRRDIEEAFEQVDKEKLVMAEPVKLPKRIETFLAEHFPADEDLAAYVICIAKRDKTIVVAQGYDSPEVHDKVVKALNQHMATWDVQ